jgi:hypothetical protein
VKRRITTAHAKAIVGNILLATQLLDDDFVSLELKDPRVYAALPTPALKAYMAGHGWRLVEEFDRSGLPVGIWQYEGPGADREIRIGVTHSTRFVDYGGSVATAIEYCAELEKRTVWQVLKDAFAGCA